MTATPTWAIGLKQPPEMRGADSLNSGRWQDVHARTPSSPALRNLAGTIPEDRERGIPLLSVREPVRRIEDVVLSRENLLAGQGDSPGAQP